MGFVSEHSAPQPAAPQPDALQPVPLRPVARPRREEVRRRLLDAALPVFVEHGYAGARLSDIARAAGFTKGAVYSNFGSKQELFAVLLAERAATVTESALREAAQEDDLDAVAARVGALLAAQVVADPKWHGLVVEFTLQAARDAEVGAVYVERRRAQRAALAEVLRERAAALGLSRVDVDSAALVLLAVLNGLALEHAVDPGAVDGPTVAAAIAGVLRGGARDGDRS